MVKNYLKIAFRNLMRHKSFSAINIIGLSIGIAACLLILQYVSFELSFDQFNKNAKDIYRVYNDRYQNGKLVQHGTITYSAIGAAMQNDFPEVVNHSRLVPFGKEIITYNTKKIGEQNALSVDNSFLTMFTYPLLAGDAKTAMQEPHSVILSEKLAKKIFDTGENNFSLLPGKLIIIGDDSMPYKITGICKDAPENSHLQFDLLTSYITLYTGTHPWKEAEYDFKDSDFWHYIQLKHGTNYKVFENKFVAFSQRHFQGNKVSGSDEKFYLQPLSKAHLYSDFEYEIGNTGSSTVVWGLLIIAVLIIIIAWVNYINLATAKSMERAKEVGIRKVAGATKQQLIRQFLIESLIVNVIGLILALFIVALVQNGFNSLIHHQLSLSYLFQKGLTGYGITASLILLIVAGIFISGFYPAFVLSLFKPILVLKGKYSGSNKGIILRKALVIGQFAVTVALIIGSIVVYQQMKFVNSRDLGINLSQVLVVRPPTLSNWDSTFIKRENSFTNEIKQLPNIKGATTTWNVAGGETGRIFDVRRSDQDSTTHFTMRNNGTSEGFISVFQIKLLAGRDFTYTDFNPEWDKLHNVILNQSAAKLLGYASPQDAIGKTIINGNRKWDIIGVINDYHQKSLHYSAEPTMLFPAYSTYSSVCLKVDTKNLPATIAAIKKIYDNFFPGNLFDYFFLDEKFNEQYSNDQLFGKVFAIFSGFAIFIACLGLFGLSLYSIMQRTKEIGVRKVLGATVPNIMILVSRDFIRSILIADIIAFPIAWFVMNKWLQNFAYRIHIGWWVFAAAAIIALLVALFTISFQAIKAAMANPVKSLRTE